MTDHKDLARNNPPPEHVQAIDAYLSGADPDGLPVDFEPSSETDDSDTEPSD